MTPSCPQNRSPEDLVAYLERLQGVGSVHSGRASSDREWEEHLHVCEACREFCQWYQVASRFSGLVETLWTDLEAQGEQDQVFLGWLTSLWERMSALVAPKDLRPNFAVALGGSFLRALQPISSRVTLPFQFGWSRHGEAASYLLQVRRENESSVSPVSLVVPAPSEGPVFVSSDRLGIVWVTEERYLWSASAYPVDPDFPVTTGDLGFQVSAESAELVDPIPGLNWTASSPVDAAAVQDALSLAFHGFQDAAHQTLVDRGAEQDPVLAALMVTLFEVRIETARLPAEKRQLRSAKAEWEGIRIRLSS